MKHKELEDPLRDIRKYLGVDSFKKINESDIVKKISDGEVSDGSKHLKKKKVKKEKKKKKKKKRHSSSDSEDSVPEKKSKVDLEKLRAERLKREKEERKRAEALLAKLRGDAVEEVKAEPVEIVQKYNSQFNPHLAKQNFRRDE